MDEERLNKFLERHGIKGQRWGIRRTPEQLGHKVHQKIFDNDQLIKSYLNTIRTMNSGQIKRGESFVKSFPMIYKSSLDDKD